MSVLSAAEHAALDAIWASDLPDVCAIYPNVPTTDANVGNAQTWPAVSQTVACAVLDPRGQTTGDGNLNDSMQPLARTVVIATGPAVAAPYRLGWTTWKTGLTRTLEVMNVRPPGSNSGTTWLDCVEVT